MANKVRTPPTGWGDRIKSLRKEAGISQHELASMLEVTRNAVTSWESEGSKSIMGANLVDLANALNTSPEFIIYGNKERILGSDFSTIEKLWISKFRRLDEKEKAIILKMLDSLGSS